MQRAGGSLSTEIAYSGCVARVIGSNCKHRIYNHLLECPYRAPIGTAYTPCGPIASAMSSTDTQLDLTIDDEAAAYIREEGGVLTIRTRPQHGCCGGRVDLATVSTEPPDELEAYVQTERDGLTVSVHKSFVSLGDEPMHVGLDRLWIWRSLYVEARAQM